MGRLVDSELGLKSEVHGLIPGLVTASTQHPPIWLGTFSMGHSIYCPETNTMV